MATDMIDNDYWFHDLDNNYENKNELLNDNDLGDNEFNNELLSDNDRMYYRYFDNLSNNKNCQPLIDFSKAYITDKLNVQIVNIYGGESSGKSLLLKLLNKFVKSTPLKMNQLNKQRLHHFNGRNIIVEIDNVQKLHEHVPLIKEMTKKEYNLQNGYIYDAEFVFIFVSKTKIPNYFNQRMIHVALENKFNNSNIEFLLEENLEALYKFIMY